MTEATARTRFGENGYTRCSETSCGTESLVTAVAVVQKYCYQQAAAVLPAGQCPEGCACLSEAAAKDKGYPACRGTRTSCGYDTAQVPLFCFEVVPDTTCTFNYQTASCTGTCPQGNSCGIIAEEKDATGAVKYGVCGCQPPATGCAYNANLNSCTGTCPNGVTCTATGKTEDANGAVRLTCGCGTEACFFDYAKDACTGSCTAGTGVCQLNTIYRDAAGKTIYGECHCKELPGQTPVTVTVTKTTPVPVPCTCRGGLCTGSCPEGQTCWMTGTTTDNLGKISCTECTCKESCTLTATNECTGSCPQGGPCERLVSRDASGAEKVSCVCRSEAGTPGAAGGAATPTGTAAAPAPDVISAIVNFFRSLFGMK